MFKLLNRICLSISIFLVILCYCPMSFSLISKENKLPHQVFPLEKGIKNQLTTFTFSSDEKTIYIINKKNESYFLYVINLASGNVINKILLNDATAILSSVRHKSIAITPDNKKLYVSCEYGNILSIDLISGEVKKIKIDKYNFIISINITQDGILFAVEGPSGNPYGKTGIYVIDVKSDRIISYVEKQILPVHYGYMGSVFNKDQSKLYLVDHIMQGLSVLDTKSFLLKEGMVHYHWDPYTIIAGNNHLYIPSFDNDSLYIIDNKNYHLSNQISIGHNPVDVMIALEKIYIANFASNTISIVRLSNNQVIKTISVGSNPSVVQASKDEKKIYVGNRNDSSISVIDTTLDQVVETLHFESVLG